MGVKQAFRPFLGVAVLQLGVRQKRSMGVAQWADVPAIVPVGAIRPRLGRASSEILGGGAG